MRAVTPLRLALSAWLVVLGFAGTLAAQEFRATVTGRVTDPAGLAMPGVTVTVTNTQTNEIATAVTNSEGVYSLPFLRPGLYKVAAGRYQGRAVVPVKDRTCLGCSAVQPTGFEADPQRLLTCQSCGRILYPV